MARLSIVICTYERPALLAGALRSILALDGLAGAGLDVVVVDNSDSGSARAVVEGLSTGAPIPVAYVTAHPPNISVARNVGCRASRGAAVAFLDDDQELAPGWLASVLDGLDRLPHDVFFGPITPIYEAPEAVTPAARALFVRASDRPAGDDLAAFDRPRTQPFVRCRARTPSIRISGRPAARISICCAASSARGGGSAGCRAPPPATSCPAIAAARATSCGGTSPGGRGAPRS